MAVTVALAVPVPVPPGLCTVMRCSLLCDCILTLGESTVDSVHFIDQLGPSINSVIYNLSNQIKDFKLFSQQSTYLVKFK